MTPFLRSAQKAGESCGQAEGWRNQDQPHHQLYKMGQRCKRTMTGMVANTEEYKAIILFPKRESRRSPFLPCNRVIFVTSYLVKIRIRPAIIWVQRGLHMAMCCQQGGSPVSPDLYLELLLS